MAQDVVNVIQPPVVEAPPVVVPEATVAADMLASPMLASPYTVPAVLLAAAAALYALFSRNSQKVAVASSAGINRSAPVRASPMALNAGGPLSGLFDKRKTCIITGTSSGLGKQTARALCNSGEWFVVMAVRDPAKMKVAALELGLNEESYTIMPLELESIRSVRNFCNEVKSMGRSIDALVCNAALYLPNQRSPSFTEDGFERCFQVNHLSHYLMIRLLLKEIAASEHKRVVVVGSITGNNNTVGGGAVYPLADLGKLQGMKAGMQKPISMIDGKSWNGAKAYKDSKVCNMQTIRELHRRYHNETGITFSTMYPGCIAETSLFRQKRGWFRTLFPLFMKYVTGGYVSEEEAGDRLAECVDSPATKKSGVYWSWNGGARTTAYFAKSESGEWALTGAGGSGGSLFENECSELVRDPYTSNEMYNLSEQLLGLRAEKKVKPSPALP
jgi:protochlorophyllide reductase